MLIELSTLPPVVAEQILMVQQGQSIDFANNGKIVGTFTKSIKQPSYADGDFDYDLERMKKAVEAPAIRVPKFNTPEELLQWTESLTDADFGLERA